jgi:hypothetical protein
MISINLKPIIRIDGSKKSKKKNNKKIISNVCGMMDRWVMGDRLFHITDSLNLDIKMVKRRREDWLIKC